MTTREKLILAAVLSALATGCVSAPDGAPAWYEQRAAESGGGYPSLHEVPTHSIANTDPSHWAEVEADVVAAGAAMKANPRAQPVAPGETAPEGFIAEARGELEQARASHEP
jgi:hypothetical protein